ncbi:MAG: serine/threonine protein kinase [Acidobacteria bacterium]|nr:serine/threonine protein kinase [Acidobacteriota bacterium]
MGRVYKGLDTEIKTKVALKLIKPEIASDRETIERFRNELKTTHDITHKNVCRMHDLNREGDTFFITMEYVSGGDLKRFIRRSKQLNIKTAVSIAKQVCEGLAEAHKLGTVHRDLSPNNIMIDNDGMVRVMDFGIACSFQTNNKTEPGVIIGTPAYMSPEQAEAGKIDPSSDIYSLGVILFEMITGRLPFEGETALSMAVKHKSEEPPDPTDFNPNVSEDLSKLILKCLAKNKKDRYKNAEQPFGFHYFMLTRAYIDKGMPEEAEEIGKKGKALGTTAWIDSQLIFIYAKRGKREKAEKLLLSRISSSPVLIPTYPALF